MTSKPLTVAERLAAIEQAAAEEQQRTRYRQQRPLSAAVSVTSEPEDVTTRPPSAAGRLEWGEDEIAWEPFEGADDARGTVLASSAVRPLVVVEKRPDLIERLEREWLASTRVGAAVEEEDGGEEEVADRVEDDKVPIHGSIMDLLPTGSDPADLPYQHDPTDSPRLSVPSSSSHTSTSSLPQVSSPSTTNPHIPQSTSSSRPLSASPSRRQPHEPRSVTWADENGEPIIVGELPAFAMRHHQQQHDEEDGRSVVSSLESVHDPEGEAAFDKQRVHSAIQAMEEVDRFLRSGVDRPGTGTREAEMADADAAQHIKSETDQQRSTLDRVQSSPIIRANPVEQQKQPTRVQSAPTARGKQKSSLWSNPRDATAVDSSSLQNSKSSRSAISAAIEARPGAMRLAPLASPRTSNSTRNRRLSLGSARHSSVRTSTTTDGRDSTSRPLIRERSSMAARMDDIAAAKARAIAEAISLAADQWNPDSPTRSATSSRPSSALTPEKRAASAALCAAAATGGRRSRPASGRGGGSSSLSPTPADPPSTRISSRQPKPAKTLWSLVRDVYCKTAARALQLANRVAQPVPYHPTIRHGFQFKHMLRNRQNLLGACFHIKLPIHHLDGRVGSDTETDDDDELSPTSKTKTNSHHPTTTDPAGLPQQQQQYYPYTFATVDRTRTVAVWDIVRNIPTHRPKAIIRLDTAISEFVFLTKFCMYAACSHDKSIKFFNSRFEMITLFRTLEPVLFIRYNTLNHELITAGSHQVCIWSLEAIKHRNVVHIQPILKHVIPTTLAKNEWISHLYVDNKNYKVYAVVDTRILVFHQLYGKQIDMFRSISSRHICAVIYHDFYQYTVIACADGTIQIRNMNNALLHEFTSHTKPVTALALYPHAPMIISSSLDYTVRMFSLKTFKEVYCLHLKDKPQDLHVMDDTQLFIRTMNSVQIWGLNHINSVFSSLSSRVKDLRRIKTPGKPARLLVRTEDGVIRFISPVNGKAITTALPLLETDNVMDLTVCAKIERMYLMLENGEIWVIATNFNPCVVVDIWKLSEAAKEDCIHVVVFDGRFKPTDPVTPGYDTSKGFAFFMAATRNGQVLVYGKRGGVRDRYQLHAAEITQMHCCQKQQLLFTCGADELIKITAIAPTSSELLQPRLSIWTHFIPRSLGVLGTIICVAGEDGTLGMYEVAVDRKEWRVLPAHNRSDDHTDLVTAICTIPKLGLFVTASKDATIRVWDTQNALVREIQFQENIHSLAVANAKGDLVIGIQNRVDIIRHYSYLPPGYMQAVQKLELAPIIAEPPIPFDDARTNWKALIHRPNRRAQIQSAETWSLFHDVNLVGTERPVEHDEAQDEIDKHLTSVGGAGAGQDAVYRELMRRMDLIATRRREVVESARRRMEAEKAEGHRQDQILYEECMRYLRMKPFFGRSREHLDGIPIDFRPTSPEGYQLDDDQTALTPYIQEAAGVGGMVGASKTDLAAPGGGVSLDVNTAATTGSTAPAADPSGTITTSLDLGATKPLKSPRTSTTQKSRRKSKRLGAAPDGVIPNSMLRHDIEAWKATHADFQIKDLGIAPIEHHAQKKASKKKSEDDTKKKKSEDYKLKLKAMLEAMPKEEEPAPMEEPTVEEEEEEEVVAPVRMRLPAHRMKVGMLEPRRDLTDPKLPLVVEKLIGYDWVPVSEIFHPVMDPANPPSLNGRRLKIDPESHTLLPIILDLFRKTPNTRVRSEIIEYINWMYEEHGIRDTGNVVKTMCRILGAPEKEDEVQLRCAMIEALARYGPNHVDVVPSLVMQMTSRHDEVRTRAAQFLKALGVHTPDNHYLTDAVGEASTHIIASASPATLVHIPTLTTAWETTRPGSGAPTTTDPRVHMTNFIRTQLRKYLIRATPQKDLVKKLRKLSIHGVETHGSMDLDDEDAGSGKGSRPGSGRRPSSGGSRAGSAGGSAGGSRAGTANLHPAAAGSRRKSISRPGSSLGAAVGAFTTPRMSLETPTSPARPAPRRMSLAPGMGSNARTRENSFGSPSSTPSGGAQLDRRVSVSSGRARKKVAFEADGSGSGSGPASTTAAPAQSGLRPSPRRASIAVSGNEVVLPHAGVGAGALSAVSEQEHAQAEMAELELMQMVTYRPSIPHHEDDGHTEMNENAELPFYQTFEAERPMSSRNPVTILQNPSSQDFVNAINFYILSRERAAARAEQERLAKLRAESEAAALAVAEEEKRLKFIEYMAMKERTRLAKIEARRRKLEEARRKEEDANMLPNLVATKLSAMRTKGIGLTHRSECHPSRETLDYVYGKFPPLQPDHPHPHLHPASVSMHIRKYNRSMPMERVDLLPFEQGREGPWPSPTALPGRRSRLGTSGDGTRPFSAMRPPTSIPLGSALSQGTLVPKWREFAIEDVTGASLIERELRDVIPEGDLKYIRGGLERSLQLQSHHRKQREAVAAAVAASAAAAYTTQETPATDRTFKTQRKYFIPALSFALEAVAAGQTYGLSDS
ncbi:hypothetical protein DFS34DRAFT_647837 [Phlyctochytrium arcticum]|nr:hypothetical protein DFS34DRAFT_647837 [Phlyctochytrium arcticum]